MKLAKTFTVLITLVVLAVVAAAVGLIVMYSGLYNVAAVGHHSSIVEWALGTTSDHSVAYHAKSVVVPADFAKLKLDEGARHFKQDCVVCHGGPGVNQGDIPQGLHPQPPYLNVSVTDMSPAEIYWVVRNGIDMTAMPGFGPTHTDKQLWAIVAFVHQMPKMTPQQFQSLLGLSGGAAAGTSKPAKTSK